LKLLVTGGAGYVGSVVANQLVEAGHETVVLDNLSKGHGEAIPAGARFVVGDLLRYFNVAGASGRFGEDHHPETHLIPLVLGAAAERRDSVELFGTDYPTRDGTAVRDYIHVEDLGRAHLLALEAAGPGEHRVYNLGNGAGFSVREVVEAACAVTGCPIEVIEAPRRSGDPAVLVASSERIRAELGWKPEKPELEDMISAAWDWMRSHPHGYG
jgi:UDP-glucose 4-epimerase